MNPITLGTLQTLSPKAVWKHEERDFTPWVAKNIDQISSAIGINLVVEQTEKRIGPYELDIFARVEGTDKPVIIENQIEETDHKHLGQLITYASGLDAALVIWIAAEVTDQHKAAIAWLNKIAKERSVSFFLIRPEIIKIDQSLPAARFQLVVGPSEFTRTISEAVEEDAPRHTFRLGFWSGLLDYLVASGNSWASGRRVSKESWIAFRVGHGNVVVQVSMAMGSRMRVEIYIYQDGGKEIFDMLHGRKDEIEAKFPGEAVSWERLDEALSSKVAVYRDYDKSKCETDTPERRALYTWIAQNLIRFREIAKQMLAE